MKKYWFLFAVLALAVFSSCDDDNEPVPGYVSTETRTAFGERFPSAKDVEWERNGDYMVVDFREGRTEKEAWFDNQGNWFLTETDIAYDQLPEAVKSSFQSSDYSSWRVDDVDYIERADMADLYVLDVESGELDADLHYSADGILVKVIGDLADGSGNTGNTGGGTGDLIPSQPSSAIEEYIQTKYPNARIIEIDREDRGYTEVDIIDNGTLLELLFDEGGAWVQTSQDVRVSQLPPVVTSAIQAAYPGYQIDDADWVETPEGEWYLVELEIRGEADLYVRVTVDGTILQS